MDLSKLKEMCNKYTVEVSCNGFVGFNHKVIDAEKLLENIHQTSSVEKDEFIKNINEKNFMSPEYESIFKSIKFKGEFKVKGDEKITGSSYIEHKSLSWL